MLINTSNSTSMLDKLNELSIEFHLTGSRFFKGNGNDWDFFTKYSEDTEILLRQLGFHALNTIDGSNYRDTNCIFVMRYIHDNLQIDIQLVNDVDLKVKAQDYLKDLGYTHPTTKEWNLAFEFYPSLLQ